MDNTEGKFAANVAFSLLCGTKGNVKHVTVNHGAGRKDLYCIRSAMGISSSRHSATNVFCFPFSFSQLLQSACP